MPDTEYHFMEFSRLELVLAHAAERRYPWHIHANHWIIGHVLSGSVMLETREARRSVKRGQSFAVRPGEAHRLDVDVRSALAVLCVGVSDTGGNPPGKLEYLLRGIRLPDSMNADSLADAVSRLLPAAGGLSGERGHGIGRLIAENPETDFPLTRMAFESGYSQWHFLRRFRKETGLTPHVFQLLCRLRMARGLLRNNVAAAEAAVSAGFSDQSHMHKVFRLHHYLTPRQFQRMSFRVPEPR